jgi:hypothetical protein
MGVEFVRWAEGVVWGYDGVFQLHSLFYSLGMGMRRTKVFSRIHIPRASGQAHSEDLSFSFFDLAQIHGRYCV